jgi:predicted CXXCH cytochrome family protein
MVCHKAVEEAFDKPFLHKPFEQRMCATCHDAHFSDYTFLLKNEGNKLCLACHKDRMEEHRHPIGVVPRKQLPFEARYGPEGELVCVTCHNPHASDGENMLPGDCSRCHDF